MPAAPARPTRLRDAAAQLGISENTLQRWIRDGAPCERLGTPGRNNGSLVNVSHIREWLARRAGISVDPPQQSDINQTIAQGLWAAFTRGNGGDTDPVWQQQRIGSGRAAMLFAEGYLSIIRTLTGREPSREEVPPQIKTLYEWGVSAILRRPTSEESP